MRTGEVEVRGQLVEAIGRLPLVEGPDQLSLAGLPPQPRVADGTSLVSECEIELAAAADDRQQIGRTLDAGIADADRIPRLNVERVLRTTALCSRR